MNSWIGCLSNRVSRQRSGVKKSYVFCNAANVACVHKMLQPAASQASLILCMKEQNSQPAVIAHDHPGAMQRLKATERYLKPSCQLNAHNLRYWRGTICSPCTLCLADMRITLTKLPSVLVDPRDAV